MRLCTVQMPLVPEDGGSPPRARRPSIDHQLNRIKYEESSDALRIPKAPQTQLVAREARLQDSSRLVCEKTRARLLQSSRFHHPCRFICWESEELDERPHPLFLAAGRESLGSCQLGDTMEARPKQFR